jgi:hypothetical protein
LEKQGIDSTHECDGKHIGQGTDWKNKVLIPHMIVMENTLVKERTGKTWY